MGRYDQLFRRKARPCLGVDISASRVKLLELDGKPGAYRVVSYASESLPADAITDHQIVDAEAVSQSISRALVRSGSRTRGAAIAVSGAAVISKVIDMPSDMTDEEIEQQIGFEADQYIPYPIEEVSLDFQVLEPDPENPDVNRVLLVACRRDNVEMRTAALEMAKLKPRLVDVEEYALRNACTLLHNQMPNDGAGSSVAIFEIGAQQMRLNVQHDRHTAYTREMPFGGQSLAEKLAEQHGLDDTDQLRGRLRTGDIDAAAIGPLLSTFADRAARQIESALQFYFSAAAERDSIDQILLTGGCALYPGFEEQMRARLNWPLAIGNPLAGLLASTSARRNYIEHEGPALMVAAGLSMRFIM